MSRDARTRHRKERALPLPDDDFPQECRALLFFPLRAGLMLLSAGLLAGISGVLMSFGFQAVAPNDARVLLLFGEYRGSVTESGFYWVNPFFTKRKITLRVRNFETGARGLPRGVLATNSLIRAWRVYWTVFGETIRVRL